MTHDERQLRPAIGRRRGLVLPLVLVSLTVALILGMCFLTSASTATAVSSGADHRLRARLIAESGLAMTLAYLESSPDWRTTRINGDWVTNQTMDGGTFMVMGRDGDQLDSTGAVIGDGNLADDANDPVTLTCVGTYDDARHRVDVVHYPPKSSGIDVNERVELRKTGLIDSYNAHAGPYSAATATSVALARSNGLSRQPYIRLRKNARVNGDVHFGPGGSVAQAVRQDLTAIVTGTTTALPTLIALADVPEPAWPTSATGVNLSHSSGVNVLSSDLWCDTLNLSGTATLRVTGNVKLYVNETMTVTDDARIEVGSPTAYGATMKDSISVNSSVPLDSYDSSLGSYGGTNVSSNAMLATNSTLAAAVTVNSTIRGDVYTGVGSVPTLSIVGTGTVTGTKGALTTPIAFPTPATLPADMPPSVGDQTITGLFTLTNDLHTDKLDLSGGALLRVSGHRRIRVNGDFLFRGQAVIDIPSDSSLSIYVAGRITVDGQGAVANTGKSPPRLQIIATGTGQTHKLGGQADLYAIIDAPNSTVLLEGNAHLYGALLARSLQITGNGGLHNDRNPALIDANPRLAATWTSGSRLRVYTNRKVLIQQRARVNAGPMDPKRVSIRHVGDEPMQVDGDAVVYADAIVPQMTVNIGGAARWTGRIEARDLSIGGTSVVTADASGGTARPGIIVDETIEVKDSAVVNATGGTTLLASNGTTDTTIWVKDNAVFKGDGYTGPGGNANREIRVAAGATFTGTKGTLALPIPVAALTAPPLTSSPIDFVYLNGISSITGELNCANFFAKGDAVVEVEGFTRLVLTGNFTVCEGARLVLRPGAHLTVYCPGRILFAGNAQVNTGAEPTRFVLSCPNAPEIVLREAAQLSATVLAPLAELKLTGSAQFYGVFAGRRLLIDDLAKFHCARGINGPITWLEQQ